MIWSHYKYNSTPPELIKLHQPSTDQSLPTAPFQQSLCRMGKPWTSSRGLGSGSLLLVIMLCGAVSSSSSAAVCNAGDKAALLTFKGQLIDKDNFLAPWKTTTNCCTWPGITCNSAGRVTILNLLDVFAFPNANNGQLKVKSGLKGAGASLGSLKALTQLEFRNVAFGFAYPLPPQIGSLPNLASLHLIDTQFIGSIPTELGSLYKLTHLILSGNKFSGGIPDSFGNLKALTSLQVPNNQLKVFGSQKISQLKKLESFDISQNPLSGAIPKWLGQLTLSDYIQISDAPALTGPIPAELCNIKGLRRIIIFNTGVSALLPGIGNCATLTELVVFDNKIAGRLPAELGKLKKLQRIAVGGNVMSGTLPASIGDLPNLTEFDIANNKFTGSIPSNYGPFVEDELSTDFSGNQLSGPIPKPLSTLRVRVFRPGNPGLCGTPLPAC